MATPTSSRSRPVLACRLCGLARRCSWDWCCCCSTTDYTIPLPISSLDCWSCCSLPPSSIPIASKARDRGWFLDRCACSRPSLRSLQRETGSALVYLAFFLMLYREGMTGSVLFTGVIMVAYFVIGIRFAEPTLFNTPTSIGYFVVMLLIQLCLSVMLGVYCNNWREAMHCLFTCLGVTLVFLLFTIFVIPFDLYWVQLTMCVLLVGYLLWRSVYKRMRNYLWIALFAGGSVIFFNSADYALNHVLEPHQRTRINVLLGLEEDLKGAGYNVHQSEIAIGSGGLEGKGFLNGTQTKLKYVPEQDTDFIFCTVGEEEGFVGAAGVLLLFLALILRLIHLAERQPKAFGRIYGYCVLSVFLFHVFINVGMVLGLTPVIGIPLPFFSYGGSSLWGFTLLLFIFLRIDAGRHRIRT